LQPSMDLGDVRSMLLMIW